MMKVNEVTPTGDTCLRLVLDSGKTLDVDVREYLDAPGYEALREPGTFAKVALEQWGNGVEWPGDLGIPVSALYRMAREQAGRAFPVDRFNAWMRRNGFSAAQAAEALGLTRRTIIYYHTGAKPIPVVVGLACDGYDARQAA